IDKNKGAFESLLAGEQKERLQDKADTYRDFEQICRNIDDRITGEKEKLWDKIKADGERLDGEQARLAAEAEALRSALAAETREREKERDELGEKLAEQGEGSSKELEELRRELAEEAENRERQNKLMAKYVDSKTEDSRQGDGAISKAQRYLTLFSHVFMKKGERQ
ncbi:MAG: hypothetical protein ACK56F_25990, partial [bacterium]